MTPQVKAKQTSGPQTIKTTVVQLAAQLQDQFPKV